MTSYISKYFVSLILLSSISFGQDVGTLKKAVDRLDVDQQKGRLSTKYTKGAYLLYDCYDKHWVCTDKLEAENCEEKRREGILEHDLRLPCAVLKKHETNSSCIDHQKWVTDQNFTIIFCDNKKVQKS